MVTKIPMIGSVWSRSSGKSKAIAFAFVTVAAGIAAAGDALFDPPLDFLVPIAVIAPFLAGTIGVLARESPHRPRSKRRILPRSYFEASGRVESEAKR